VIAPRGVRQAAGVAGRPLVNRNAFPGKFRRKRG